MTRFAGMALAAIKANRQNLADAVADGDLEAVADFERCGGTWARDWLSDFTELWEGMGDDQRDDDKDAAASG